MTINVTSRSMPCDIDITSHFLKSFLKICNFIFTGRVYVYMGKREFVSCDGVAETINGVVNIQDHHDTLKGRRVYVQLVITFRHGREEEETMGLSFKKELILDRVQVKG